MGSTSLTYNAFSRQGDFDFVADIDVRARQAWDNEETLPNDLEICRTILFFEQRRFRHLDAEPANDDDRFVREILGRIRDLSGGEVPGPGDESP